MQIRIEMGPKEFALTTRVPGLLVGENVALVLADTFDLTGRIESVKDAVYGGDQTPCTRVKIGLTSTDIARYNGMYLRGATVTGKRSGASGVIYARDANRYAQPMIRQRYVSGIFDEIETLLRRATEQKDDARARAWFGADLTGAQLQRIHIQTATMNQGLQAVATVHCVCTSGTYLAAADLDLRPRFQPGGCQVLLGVGFTFDRYSWGEKVCTVAHELSHWFLSTVDATYQGEDAYGIKAFDMVNDPEASERRKCLTNAENWGYYLCSYRAEGDGKDWRNMTRDELAARPAFNLGAQTVNATVVHLN